MNSFPHLLVCLLIFPWLSWHSTRDLLISSNFLIVFSSISLREFLISTLMFFIIFRNVVFNVIFLCFICLGIFRSCCHRIAGTWSCLGYCWFFFFTMTFMYLGFWWLVLVPKFIVCVLRIVVLFLDFDFSFLFSILLGLNFWWLAWSLVEMAGTVQVES